MSPPLLHKSNLRKIAGDARDVGTCPPGNAFSDPQIGDLARRGDGGDVGTAALQSQIALTSPLTPHGPTPSAGDSRGPHDGAAAGATQAATRCQRCERGAS